MQSLAPTAKGVNALELWMLSCLLMVFAALCEYGVVLFVKRRSAKARHLEKQQMEKACSGKHMATTDSTIINNTTLSNAGRNNRWLSAVDQGECKLQGRARKSPRLCSTDGTTNISLNMLKIDSFALIIFPIIFSVFIAVYCIMYIK